MSSEQALARNRDLARAEGQAVAGMKQLSSTRGRFGLRIVACAAMIAAAIAIGAGLAHAVRNGFNPTAYPSLAASRVISLAALLEEKCAKPFDYLNSPQTDG
jgi:hypothetical protein